MKQDLEVFVRDALAKGVSRDEIRAALEAAGWPRKDIEAALDAWADSAFGVPVPRRSVGLAAREAFIFLMLFATLYFVAFNVGAVLFAAIERWIPDPAFSRWDAHLASIRWGTAYILIGLPVHLWMSRIAGRSSAAHGGDASPVDRWLTYLTLFIAALVLIGNLVVIVSSALGGELTARFILKTLVVFLIAGSIFAHHLGRMNRDEAAKPGMAWWMWTARGSAVGAALTMVVGLWLSGTPGAARAMQLDRHRVESLMRIRAAVTEYYRIRGAVPAALESLTTVPAGASREGLADPVTGELYGYAVVDSARYRLCATFDRATPVAGSRAPTAPGSDDAFWAHPAGDHCFDLDAAHKRDDVFSPPRR